MLRSLCLLSAIFIATGCASTEADEINAAQVSTPSVAPDLVQHDARLTGIAKRVEAISPAGKNSGMTYLVMFDACESALNSNASNIYSRPSEQWKGAYCSCDTFITLEGWLEDSEMRKKLETVDFTDYVSANSLLSKHKIFENDAYCRPMTERAANG